ncbi:unnamed protein product [Phaedon cochleariae]|uniref:Uncharacterized protein n=1 Tax=Phaedon cochleariae TaxID=80249 RepID=A0A9N9WZ05_PHACE|nr:unnamed protein product [Phaedon cochleariae]
MLTTATAALTTFGSTSPDNMKCSYGERGSLTATCFNANPPYFRATPYRFDQLDETVKCQNCTLKTIEAGTFDISGNQIKILVLNDSKIENIRPKGFVGLIFLEELVLSHNEIRSIYPNTFIGIKKIKSIDLSHNQLNILSDDGFLELVNMEELNLETNSIQTIAAYAFHGLSKLKNLNLKNNKIRELQKVLTNLTSLQLLNLENNHLQSLNGDEFLNLTSLSELNLSNNKLASPVIELKPNNQLRSLQLRSNLIVSLAPQFLKGLHALELLDLSYNQVGTVEHKVLHSLFSLRDLNLAYNGLRSLQTGTFSALPQLEVLNCSHNSIVVVEITGVFSLHSLHALDLSHNLMTDLDYVALIDRLPRLSYLRLEHNLLPCGLEDEMETYFQEDNFKFVLSEAGNGTSMCLDEPPKKSLQVVDVVAASAENLSSRVTGAEITIMVLMSVVFMCIGFLFFMQYRTYQEVRSRSSKRSISTSHLMAAEAERNEDGYP